MLSRLRLIVAAGATLIALAAAALLVLAPAQAEPLNPLLTLTLVDESDNVIPPDSTVTVQSNLRFRGELGGEDVYDFSSELLLGGDYHWTWDEPNSRRLEVSGSTAPADPPAPGRVGDELDFFSPTKADGTPVGATGSIFAAGLHRRTLLATSVLGEAYLYDTILGRQVAVITAPDTVDTPANFGRADANIPNPTSDPNSSDDHNARDDGSLGAGAAVWQESTSTAWLFLTSLNDDIEGTANVGSLYIYKVDWSVEPVTVELVKRLHPPRSEFSNVSTSTIPAPQYGASLDISDDGSTLAVGSRRMNHIGAVYIYQRPSGPGRSWGDIEYEDGIKLTVAPTPPWGDPAVAATRPFSWASGGSCQWWCHKVAQLVGNGNNANIGHRNFAYPDLALSGDGKVLVVSAYTMCHLIQKSLGSYGCGSGVSQSNQGLVWVFVAPKQNPSDSDDQRSWSHVPRAGATKTLIPAGADGSSFNPANHYAPGPQRQVTTETRALRSRNQWAANVFFGQTFDISPDGLTIMVAEGGNGVILRFTRSNISGWSGGDIYGKGGQRPGYNANQPLHGVGMGGIFFNEAGDSVMIGWPHYRRFGANNGGTVLFWNRSSGGSWGIGDLTRGDDLFGPLPNPIGAYFGARPIWGLDYQRYAISRPIPAQTGSLPSGFFVSATDHLCLPEQVDGDAELSCDLGVETLTILPQPFGQQLTIGGEATISVGDEVWAARAEPIELTIGEVIEVSELKLERATNDQGTTDPDDDALYPDTIADGETTTLRIQVLNENGKAAATNSVDMLSVTTTLGELSTSIGGGCQGGNGTLHCLIDGSALTATASAATNSDNILVTLRHAGTTGEASVTARVTSSKGGFADSEQPLTIALAGAPAALAIAAPGAAVLNLGTPDSGADQDDRDLLTLAVTAADQAGRRVDAPTNRLRATLTGPDGKRVTSGVELEWPLGGADTPTLDGAGNRQVRINVNRAAAQPLANGEYTLEVRAGSLTATQTFIVGGGPATLSLSEVEGTLAAGEQVSLTAIVLDADGNSVPDGTPVGWSATDVGTTTVLVQLSAEARTTNGQASATWLVLSAGAAAVRAQSGTAADLRLLDVAAAMAAAAEPPRPADHLFRPTPGLATWTGEGSTTAAALLDDLPGVDSILFWSGTSWQRYARSNGQPVPGSVNFKVTSGAVLWIAE